MALGGASPERLAQRAIANLAGASRAEAGIILVDRRGRIAYAHNAESMQVATFEPAVGIRHFWVAPIAQIRRP